MTAITGDEIVTIIDVFMAAWPGYPWEEKTIAVWVDGLGDPQLAIDGEVAIHTARQCVRKWDRPGSISSYLSEYRNELERSRLGRRDGRGLPAAPASVDRRRAVLDQLRDALNNPRPHDHHQGVASCQTCIDALRRHIEEGCEHHARHREELDKIAQAQAVPEPVDPTQTLTVGADPAHTPS